MKILVCIKQVPDTTEVKIDPVTNNLVREGVPSIMNPYDESALDTALALQESNGGTVTLISMGPAQAGKELEKGLAAGADKAYLLCDRKLGGADTLATGYALAGLAQKIGFDLILCGNEAIDGCTGQVGPCMGEHLGIPAVTYADKVKASGNTLTVVRNTGKTRDYYDVDMPALVCINKKYSSQLQCCNSKEPQPIQVLDAGFLDKDKIGSAGSPTKVASISVSEKTKSYLQLDYRWNCDERIEYIMNGGLTKKDRKLIRTSPQKQAELIMKLMME